MKRFLLSVLILGSLFACERKEIDLDLLDDLAAGPELLVPVVKAKLDLSDFVQEDSLFTIDPDSGIRVVYVEDSLFGFSLIDFLNIPDQNPTSFTIINGAPDLDVDLGLGTIAGAELSSAEFDAGYLKYTVTTDTFVSSGTDLKLVIKNATIGGTQFSNTINLPANNLSITDSIDLSGLTFDFSNGGTAVNFMGLIVGMENAGTAKANQLFNLEVQFKSLIPNNAQGFFGERVVNIPSGSFQFDISGVSEFVDGFRLENPKITLKTRSTVGLGLDIAPDFDGINKEGTITSLDANPLIIQPAPAIGQTVTSDLVIDKSNSAIVDFLEALPNEMLYSGEVTLNKGLTTANNFIESNSTVEIGLEIDLPLELSAKNMKIEETISDFSLDAGEEQTDFIEKLTLYFKTTNGFPFDVDVNVTFLDTITGDSLQGVAIPLLIAAPVDNVGRSISSSVSDFEISFTSDQIDGLLDANALKIEAKLNSTDNGDKVVKMFTDYGLELQMAVRTKLFYGL